MWNLSRKPTFTISIVSSSWADLLAAQTRHSDRLTYNTHRPLIGSVAPNGETNILNKKKCKNCGRRRRRKPLPTSAVHHKAAGACPAAAAPPHEPRGRRRPVQSPGSALRAHTPTAGKGRFLLSTRG
ncbi:hypothetical protein EVAR_30401_1 [Eumeta japonica]|uniref:Uncharacterized protein n=1 Tax=Eumeta variegata TaxID=151549 RepID=A0A4C1W6U7_EUMVA|nr:hypothetical protein EVAR_30401_1 [Eumeta japonica]